MNIPQRPVYIPKSHKFMPFSPTDSNDPNYLQLQTDTPPSKVCMECGQLEHYRLHKPLSSWL